MNAIVDVPVVDAHHHLAKLDLGYPWLAPDAPVDRYHGDDRKLRQDYLIEQYLADASLLPLAASVHIENGAADPIAEASWIGEVIAARSPVPAAHVARADLSSEQAERHLDELARMPHVRGVRHILNWHPDRSFTHTPRPDIIREPEWRHAFARLARLNLSFDLQVFADQLPEAARLAHDHPDTSIILDHAGMPLGRDAAALREWALGLRTVAQQSNVTVKISALGTTDHHWSIASIAPIVNETIQTFGPDRVMFASNFPVDGMYSTLADLYRAFASLTAEYSREERAQMFGLTAARVYRLDLHSL